MTTLTMQTKAGQAMHVKAQSCIGYTLQDVYGRYSAAKETAFMNCRKICTKEGGRNFRIISKTAQAFSVAWETDKGTRIETSRNSYLVLK